MNSETLLKKKLEYQNQTRGIATSLSLLIERAKQEGIEPYQLCVVRRGDMSSGCESPHVMLSLQWFGPNEVPTERRLYYKQISDPLLEKMSSAICQARSEGIEPFELTVLDAGTRIAGFSFESANVVFDWFSPYDGLICSRRQKQKEQKSVETQRSVPAESFRPEKEETKISHRNESRMAPADRGQAVEAATAG